MESWMPHRSGWVTYAVFGAYVAVIFMGGVIAGWQRDARLAQPYLVEVGDDLIEPQGVSVARWTRTYLGSGNRIATDASNAKLLLAYGDQYPLTGREYGIKDMMFSPYVGRTEQQILHDTEVRYVTVDRRRISWDHVVGLYFDHAQDAAEQDAIWIDPQVITKFDRQENVDRICDSGNIVVYSVGALTDGATLD
jgi:hypothetical protein